MWSMATRPSQCAASIVDFGCLTAYTSVSAGNYADHRLVDRRQIDLSTYVQDNLARSARLEVRLAEELLDGALGHAERTPHADGFELPGVYETVDRHLRHPHLIRHLGDGQERRSRCHLGHLSLGHVCNPAATTE